MGDAKDMGFQFLTLDIEEWYHANYEAMGTEGCDCGTTSLESNVDRLIDLCEAAGVRATCFVLGEVAKAKPQVVRKLDKAGHEIASHGFSHGLVKQMTAAEFKCDAAKTNRLLEDITGRRVRGYRAPSFSVDEGCLEWFYGVLEELDFKYSSSVFPGSTFLYGIPGFPGEIHFPIVAGRRAEVLEIPVNALRIMGKDVGLYVRLFSAGFLEWYMKRRRGNDKHTVLYLHPREIDPDQPRLKLPFFQSRIHYWGIRQCEHKLGRVLIGAGGKFVRMCEAVGAIAQ